jgi:DHA1 family bicyclomycin/chloramphenicol resistance-like MFS transporter
MGSVAVTTWSGRVLTLPAITSLGLIQTTACLVALLLVADC